MDNIPNLTQAMSGVQTVSGDTSSLLITILKETRKPFTEIGDIERRSVPGGE